MKHRFLWLGPVLSLCSLNGFASAVHVSPAGAPLFHNQVRFKVSEDGTISLPYYGRYRSTKLPEYENRADFGLVVFIDFGRYNNWFLVASWNPKTRVLTQELLQRAGYHAVPISKKLAEHCIYRAHIPLAKGKEDNPKYFSGFKAEFGRLSIRIPYTDEKGQLRYAVIGSKSSFISKHPFEMVPALTNPEAMIFETSSVLIIKNLPG